MSREFTVKQLAVLIARDCAEQGLPPTIEEPLVYRAIATLLAGDDELIPDTAGLRDDVRRSA